MVPVLTVVPETSVICRLRQVESAGRVSLGSVPAEPLPTGHSTSALAATASLV